MANLSVTTECNSSCKYCFARGALSTDPGMPRHMSRDVFERSLRFLERSSIDEVRLLGGEPTLHPEFPRMVELALGRLPRVRVFSNGLMPERALRSLEAVPADRMSVLVNAVSPGDGSQEEADAQTTCFRRLGRRVMLGLNVPLPATQMGFLLDFVDSFGLSRSVRVGLAHPCLDEANDYLHPRYYPEVGRRVAAFAGRARAAGIETVFDCGLVPCMFPPEAANTLGASWQEVGRRCSPVLDVLPDGRVVPCYPLARLASMSLPDEEDAAWLRAEFTRALSTYRRLGIMRECAACPAREDGRCGGGCLALALRRVRHEPFAVRAPTPCDANAGEAAKPRTRITAASPGAAPAKVGRSRLGGAARPGCRAARGEGARPGDGEGARWVVPFIDEPAEFWEEMRAELGEHILEVYYPLPAELVPSGRPARPARHLAEFRRRSPFPQSVLVNPLVLPRPVEEVAPAVVEALRRAAGEFGVRGATVANLELAARIRDALPELTLTASVLADISLPGQVVMADGVFDALVPASRAVRDLAALAALREAFAGRIRLIVNEGCLPGCPMRAQHFYEMALGGGGPRSLCDEMLGRHPWLRLTGAWVLPQHLHLYDGQEEPRGPVDGFKLSGRVTLADGGDYMRVLRGYVNRLPLSPHEIGGGPASPLGPMEITEDFFARTLSCGRRCGECRLCPDYWREHAQEG